jgi:peptide/nickel transport system permease protein
MPEKGGPGARAAGILLLALALVAALAPVIANDRPLLARIGGRLAAPALADLPLAGRLFDRPGLGSISWDRPPREAQVLWRAPVPHSYRGIRLDEALQPPCRRHPLGTDALGRDLLARLIHGMRPSLAVGFGATAVALLVGGLLGALAGLRGGATDLLVVRIADVVACFPPFILALAFVAASGRAGLAPLVTAIAVNRWTGTARYVRGEVLHQRRSVLWAAARASGASVPGAALRHMLPLIWSPLAVMAAFGVAHAIMLESGLSFVGFGIEPPAPSWGIILAEARGTLGLAWWPVLFPAAALLLVLGALCLAADRAGEGGRGAPLA